MDWLKAILEKHKNQDGIIDMDAVMKEINKEAPKHTVPKDVYNTLASEKATLITEKTELENQLNEYETSKLTDEEKNQRLIDGATAKEEEYQIKINRLNAENILIKAGMEESDFKDFIDGVVTKDADATTKVVEAMANAFKTKIDSISEKVKSDQIKNTARPPKGGATEDKLTDAEILAKEVSSSIASNGAVDLSGF